MGFLTGAPAWSGPVPVSPCGRQQGLPELDPAVSGFVGMAPSACRTETPGVLVIGAGAGGLSAAIAASEAGADVLVIDERSMAGGQFYKQAAGELGEPPLDRQQRDGARLVERGDKERRAHPLRRGSLGVRSKGRQCMRRSRKAPWSYGPAT